MFITYGFSPIEMIDVGIGQIKHVVVIESVSEDIGGEGRHFIDHPAPHLVLCEPMEDGIVRVENTSQHVAMLRPGVTFFWYSASVARFEQPVDEWVEPSIADLDLGVRVTKALEQARYTNVPQLRAATDTRLLSIVGIGPSALRKIRERCDPKEAFAAGEE